MVTERSREVRVRRIAQRQDLRLVKSRLRDPRAVGYGRYMLVSEAGAPVYGADQKGRPVATLEDCERFMRI